MGSNSRKRKKFYKHLLILIAILGAGYFFVSVYLTSALDTSKVCGSFEKTAKSKSPRLCFEIADSEGKRAKGLMYKKAEDLGKTEGMIFVYETEGNYSFWMKNTYIPLDMIFLNSEFKVVGIVENTEPLTEKGIRIEKKSRYIVELNAGSAKEFGIVNDSVLQLEKGLKK